MKPIKLMTLAEYSQGQFFNKKEDILITSITTDSRKAKEGSIFACIKGERVDGHDFIEKAAALGASAILCEKAPEGVDIPYILVPSTLLALQNMARRILEAANIPVVAIGGSVGKTSTKEIVASVVSQKFNILKTEGNFNNDLGLPLTIFNLEEEHEAAVLELGISDFGEMHLLASIARPDICVLTNIGDCHLEFLGDRNGVLKAKSEMFDFIEESGHIILNGDDAHLKTVKKVRGVIPEFYGFGEENAFRAVNIEKMGPLGSRFDIQSPLGDFSVVINMPGEHMVLNALAACAVGESLGLTKEQIAKGIEEYKSIDGRFMVTVKEDYTIIDDCYNANPMSMKASLKALSEIPGRKVAILGDMGELGKDEIIMHKEVGECAGELGIDVVYAVGELSKNIASGAMEKGSGKEMDIHHFDTKEELMGQLKVLIKKGDIILIKASHFMDFTKIVNMLKG